MTPGGYPVAKLSEVAGIAAAAAPVQSVAGRAGAVTLAVADVTGAAALASPALTGTPTAPNAAAGTNTSQLATTSFVAASFVTYAYAGATYATANNATLTGTPTAPTQAKGDNSTRIATTAYADRAVAGITTRTQLNDAAYTVLATDRTVAVIALSAARILTLPAASAYPQGATLTVVDESGACSPILTLTLAAAGTDTINGSANAVLSVPYSYLALESNGSNKWTIIDGPSGVVSSLNGGPLAGFRNRVLNGNFAINQRGQTSGTALAAGVYGHDRWKAGASGCTYTFTAGTPDTSISITAGTLLQVVESVNIEGGAFVLSWTGTATARVYQGTATGSYAASPLVVTSLPAGTNTTVEFGTGTLGKVQLEPGSVATPFERRPQSIEMLLCQRYYYVSNPSNPTGALEGTITGFVDSSASSFLLGRVAFPVAMRIAPTLTFYNNGVLNQMRRFTSGAVLTLSSIDIRGLTPTCYVALGQGAFASNTVYDYDVLASAEL